MSTLVQAPQQYSQPSRKGKKAWRKNVDVSEVQEGLRLLKDEEIKGCVSAYSPVVLHCANSDFFTTEVS
jgi:hypothetical protein